jgi:hypothetical protein
MHSLASRALLLVFVVSCKPGPPPIQNSTPLMHPTGPTFDGFSLGDPIGSFIAKFGEPCDSDPIDKERSTLFFWAGTEGCKEQKAAFPESTTVVALTPYAKAEREQPIDLLVWFGGAYFTTRSTLEIHIGDAAAVVEGKLGEPTFKRPIDDLALPEGEGRVPGVRQASYKGDIHALFRDEHVVGIAVGKLKGGSERENVLSIGYGHQLRYANGKKED